MNLFATTIIDWYKENKRDLPWRDTKDPYKIWISEIILQQTRVVQGYDYYCRFMEHFPDVETLAKASEDEVMKCWQGLGYYSRARNLHEAARTIAEKGAFPVRYEDVRALKGVGRSHLFLCLRHAVCGGRRKCVSRIVQMAGRGRTD